MFWRRRLLKPFPFQIYDELRKELSTIFKADWTPEDRCLDTIKSTYRQTGYVLDTHSAVAMDIASRFVHANRPMVISATAHYSKFAHDVLRGLGEFPSSHDPTDLFTSLHKLKARPVMHANLESVIKRPQVQKAVCEADVSRVMKEIESFLKR